MTNTSESVINGSKEVTRGKDSMLDPLQCVASMTDIDASYGKLMLLPWTDVN